MIRCLRSKLAGYSVTRGGEAPTNSATSRYRAGTVSRTPLAIADAEVLAQLQQNQGDAFLEGAGQEFEQRNAPGPIVRNSWPPSA